MRLIDADEVIKAVGMEELEETLNMFPTAAEPVQHAHWKDIGHLMGNRGIQIACCSRCGFLTLKFADGDGEIEPHTPYCAWCGATMDEGE